MWWCGLKMWWSGLKMWWFHLNIQKKYSIIINMSKPTDINGRGSMDVY